jgi:DNA-binding transcriptional MerR regulator
MWSSCQANLEKLNAFCTHIAEKLPLTSPSCARLPLGLTGTRGIYSIGAIARMLGLSQATIRSWEERYGVVVAERSDGGRRLYTRDHLDQLRFVKARLDEGLSAADAHRLLADSQAGPGPAERRPAPSNGRSFLVLLAESDRNAAELNEFYLRTEGYDVETTLSAEEAEEKFAAEEPALTIVELMISGGVGLKLCQRLKGLRATPVLTISSLDLREQAMAAGADAFLLKPLEPLQVVSAVKDLLGHSAIIHQGSRAADG